MRAITVEPGKPSSGLLEDIPEPPAEHGPVLVRTLAVGVCGTDVEIVNGGYGWAPPGRKRLVIGHESLGEVLEAPPGSGLDRGDRVVGIVRRPDPVPCASCASGEWDMCRNGRYTERGIKSLDGYASERYRIEPEYAVVVDGKLGERGVLLEPASVVAKAWDQIERIGARTSWKPRSVLVTGAGPIGLLAALLGAQRGLEVRVLDRVTEGPKPGLVRDLGATYHASSVQEAGAGVDVVIECTGVGKLIYDAMQIVAPVGLVCLAGVSSGGRTLPVDVQGLNREMVLENTVVFGTVNANRRHYQAAAESLARADQGWLDRLITRRVQLDRWAEALVREPADVKPIVMFA
ncbi:theronine dehydrogenase [Sorangium cellulosum]|uniref:Theronine dehydrogenase n=1 Tax=Sorangium cellulosum TaxID=56 RepID=A0A150RJX6_SORCE|nr:theronine dehydrogenase [Sorangium cellulosum]